MHDIALFLENLPNEGLIFRFGAFKNFLSVRKIFDSSRVLVELGETD
jgi:hypothetical protein